MNYQCDVAIIGAGPAGACAAAMLANAGVKVSIFERETFPRFSIGESLLPQCMTFLEQAGLLDAVNNYGFQPKDGAVFLQQGEFSNFEFAEKFSEGPFQTYQVQRGAFDKLLADGAEQAGCTIHYRHQIEAVKDNTLTVRNLDDDQSMVVEAGFILDASGFGRVLPKLLDLETPSDFPVRQSVFTHVKENLPSTFDRNKILITVHPVHQDIWFWLIPFSNGTSSLGVVGECKYFDCLSDLDLEQQLFHYVSQVPQLQELLEGYEVLNPMQTIKGYSANVKSLYGDHFALLGNAGEFLDPVFSSGVTIAMKSSALAVPLVLRTLKGETIDWHEEYSIPLRKGISTFKTFVEGWYNGDLRKVIFYPTPVDSIKRKVCSILAGYAWDEENPLVKNSQRRLKALAQSCSE